MIKDTPTKTYRGTWDELMTRRAEFAPDAVLELKVYAPQIDQENQEIISLLQSWREEDKSDDPQELELRDTETQQLLTDLQASRLALPEMEAALMLLAVALDSSPLGLVTQKVGKSPEGDACRLWMENLLRQGVKIYVPEIADCEVRRELLRAGKPASVLRLDRLKQLARYVPLTTNAMLEAAALWAQVRNLGLTTADIHALDGDVIVAAQVLSLGYAPSEIVIATSNVRHLSRFAPTEVWGNIKP